MNYATNWSGGNNSIWDLYFNENPELGYQRQLNQLGVRDSTPYGRFAQNFYGQRYRNYLTDLPNKPFGHSWTDDLGTLGQDLKTEFARLPASQRGDHSQRFAGPVRFIGW